MRTNAPHTIDSVTLHLNRVAIFAADFTIRLIFSAKFSAAEEGAELAAAFSKRSLAELPVMPKIDNGARICVTTCRSRSRKPRLAPKKKSKFENWMPASNAAEVELSPDRAASIALFVAVEVR